MSKSMVRVIITLTFALVFIFSFVSCRQTETQPSQGSENSIPETEAFRTARSLICMYLLKKLKAFTCYAALRVHGEKRPMNTTHSDGAPLCVMTPALTFYMNTTITAIF